MGYKIATKAKTIKLSLLAGAIMVIAIIAGILTGGVPVAPVSLLHPGTPGYIILHDVRIPRVLMAALAGIALGIVGGVYQSVFRNPIADPYILGVGSGAALGAVVAVSAGLSWLISPVFAFVAAVGTVLFVYYTAGTGTKRANGTEPGRLILAGIIANTFCGAFIMLLIALSPDKNIGNIIFWLMGDLSGSSYTTVLVAAIAVTTGAVLIYTQAGNLNIMLLGDEQAIPLGIDAERVKIITIGASSLMLAGVVSFIGLISFAGLIIPHIIKLLFGIDNRLLLPLSAIAGAAFVVICDLISRAVIAPVELPIGVITALVGAPLFAWLLGRKI